ncbi:MAG TPA: hydroxyproline-2-epimerase, partial [Gammaproteobacteria bacterium]|nr:hydroxyproline-2-epimerase [Gammaproteobacteria bacterium]
TYALVYEPAGDGGVIATIEGTAFVTAEITLIFDSEDPFRCGI